MEKHVASRFPLRPEDTARTIDQELWQMLKDWWGPEAEVRELGLIEQMAKTNRVSPLVVLRQALRYIIQNGQWG